jgi:diguanylate cyclase (GGDEF)-like protein
MGDRTALSTGGALALFLAYIYVTAIRHGRSLHENLYLRFKAVEDEKKVKQILNNSPIGACISDLEDDELIFYNVRYRDLLKGYVNSQQTLRSIMTKDDYQSVMKSLKTGGQVRDKLISLKSATPSQEDKWVLVSFTRYDHNHKPAVLSWYYDITGIKRVGEKTEFMAYHDPLTQLPNRELFHDRVTKSIQQAKRDNKQLAIMFIDLDGFKKINDEYGHHVGDEILKQAASSMQAVLREVDTIARLGGDEFGVVTLLTDGQDVISIAQKLRSAIDKNYLIEGQKHWLTASVGISIYPDNGTTEAELVQCADAAMYKVKREGRNDVRLYAEL